jgi:hypothetical protein
MGAAGGKVEAGLESRTSACTAGVETVTSTAASASEETPARRHNPTCVFRLAAPDFLGMTICISY